MDDALFAPPRVARGFAFVGEPLDRASDLREDAQRMKDLRARPEACTILIARDMPILRRTSQGPDPFFPLAQVSALGGSVAEAFLGLADDGAPVFAAALVENAVELVGDAGDGFFDRRVLKVPGRDDLELIDLRSIAVQGLVAPPTLAILGQAKSALHWHAKHRFCANCGVESTLASGGWRRDCPACKTQHFPRTDPVVIMLAVAEDSCLLGRQPRFPKGMYSCLAGFLEPGESVEDAVRREIFEEAGIKCGSVAYVASQPWPFPASLMIGCLAEAKGRDIRIDAKELEDARWFSRDEARALLAGRHPDGLKSPTQMAIAHHILKTWVEG